MNTELRNRCDLLVQNRTLMREVFKWEGESISLAGSSLYVGLNLQADPEKLKACEALLKQKTGTFSAYRGNVKIPLLCKMAANADPETYLDRVHSTVEQMKPLKWVGAEYKVLAAMTICDHLEPYQVPGAIETMSDLYQNMKQTHPWLTSDEDIPFAAMLAVSGYATDTLMTEMEACYNTLTAHFRDKNAVQSLSHVLALDEEKTEEKCRRVIEIFDLLKSRKHKYGTGYELALLGTLSMLDLPVETIAAEIIEADDYLKPQKGFGNFTMGESTRRMYAALMVMDTHMPPAARSHESLVNSMLALVIAMEICMILLMTSVFITTSC